MESLHAQTSCGAMMSGIASKYEYGLRALSDLQKSTKPRCSYVDVVALYSCFAILPAPDYTNVDNPTRPSRRRHTATHTSLLRERSTTQCARHEGPLTRLQGFPSRTSSFVTRASSRHHQCECCVRAGALVREKRRSRSMPEPSMRSAAAIRATHVSSPPLTMQRFGLQSRE